MLPSASMASQHVHTFSILESSLPSYDELQASFSAQDLSLAAADTLQHHDRYFDSPPPQSVAHNHTATTRQGRLAAAGLLLRQRVSNGQRHASLLAVLDDGLEPLVRVAMPLTQQRWNREIKEALRNIAFTSSLQCILELNTHRISYPVVRQGHILAQAHFDEVSARLPGSSISSHFQELVLALAPQRQQPRWQAAILKALEPLLSLTPNSTDRLERARILLSHQQAMQDLS